jgi:hypothetical protein
VRRAGASLLILIATIAVGCGRGSSGSDIPGGADPEEVQVIKDWANDLAAGDLEAAAARFKLPSLVQNGTPPLQLRTRGQVLEFNQSLPCGAELTEAEAHGGLTIATFELTERPGRGECGAGTGLEAKTAFVIEDGLIAEWRRVAEEPVVEPPEGPVV